MNIPKLPNDIIIKILNDRKIIKQNERYKKQYNFMIYHLEAINEYIEFNSMDFNIESECKVQDKIGFGKEILYFIHSQELFEYNQEEMFHNQLCSIINNDP